MTCPRCGKKTCYACRKDVYTGNHTVCGKTAFRDDRKLHQAELASAEEQIRSELTQDEEKVLDIFKPSTSKQ